MTQVYNIFSNTGSDQYNLESSEGNAAEPIGIVANYGTGEAFVDVAESNTPAGFTFVGNQDNLRAGWYLLHDGSGNWKVIEHIATFVESSFYKHTGTTPPAIDINPEALGDQYLDTSTGNPWVATDITAGYNIWANMVTNEYVGLATIIENGDASITHIRNADFDTACYTLGDNFAGQTRDPNNPVVTGDPTLPLTAVDSTTLTGTVAIEFCEPVNTVLIQIGSVVADANITFYMANGVILDSRQLTVASTWDPDNTYATDNGANVIAGILIQNLGTSVVSAVGHSVADDPKTVTPTTELVASMPSYDGGSSVFGTLVSHSTLAVGKWLEGQTLTEVTYHYADHDSLSGMPTYPLIAQQPSTPLAAQAKIVDDDTDGLAEFYGEEGGEGSVAIVFPNTINKLGITVPDDASVLPYDIFFKVSFYGVNEANEVVRLFSQEYHRHLIGHYEWEMAGIKAMTWEHGDQNMLKFTNLSYTEETN